MTPCVLLKGSLRWWTTTGEHHVKGTVIFDVLVNPLASVLPSKPEPRYRIRYDGDGVIGGKSSYFTSGSFFLPSGPWQLYDSKLKSENSKGRAILVQFKPNSQGLDWFQLSVPITDTCDEGRLFVKAIKRAQAEHEEYMADQKHHLQLKASQLKASQLTASELKASHRSKSAH